MNDQSKTTTSVATTNHPSGLTWARWHWPFKTEAERKQIQEWLMLKDLTDPRIPF